MDPNHPCPHPRNIRGETAPSGGGLGRALTALALGAGVGAIGVGISRALLPPRPPVAKKIRHEVIFGEVAGRDHGGGIMTKDHRKVNEDFYFWMRDDKRRDRKVLQHLKEENRYTRRVMRPLNGFVQDLYQEMKGHLQETDQDVPYAWGGWLYYRRTEEGKSYSILCRKREIDGKEIVLLDENEMAKGENYFDLARWMPSPDHTFLGYTTDVKGDENYKISFRKLKENGDYELLKESIKNTAGSLVWGRDNSEVYYMTKDEAQRNNKVWRHKMGTPIEDDICLYTENDPVFSAFLSSSRSRRFIYLGSGSSESSEIYFIDLQAALAEKEAPKINLVSEREANILYDVEESGSTFYIVTNADGATNFKIMQAPIGKSSRKHWTEFLPYCSDVKIDSISCFIDKRDEPYGIVEGRQGGFTQLWFIPKMDIARKYMLRFDSRAYLTWLDTNRENKTNKIRYGYSSLTTPSQFWEYDIFTRERRLLKQSPVPNYDEKFYATKTIEATSTDGVKIPMSMVWKTSTESSEPRPCHLYGYGSYEISVNPSFRSVILPFLDRGVVYVIAHVRGGGEFGRKWYEDAKYETKKKTFEDFITCAKHLINTRVTEPNKLSIEGRSAGGLLMGSVLNMAPELFKVVCAGVPFVDVLNTMSDPSLPLTTGEWLEWGNPHTEKFYKVMKEYCPYSNVGQKKYPAMIVTGGLNDPRVAYWEPAKWVAKLREYTTGEGKILLKTEMNTGHFSASDRYHYLKERAFELAFVLDQLGVPREVVGSTGSKVDTI